MEEPVFSSCVHRHLEEMCLYMAKMNRTSENLDKFRKGSVFEQFLKHCRIKPVLLPTYIGIKEGVYELSDTPDVQYQLIVGCYGKYSLYHLQ